MKEICPFLIHLFRTNWLLASFSETYVKYPPGGGGGGGPHSVPFFFFFAFAFGVGCFLSEK